jgi:hypothetical protein
MAVGRIRVSFRDGDGGRFGVRIQQPDGGPGPLRGGRLPSRFTDAATERQMGEGT